MMTLHVSPLTPDKYRWGWELMSSSVSVALGRPQGFTTSIGAVTSAAKALGGFYAPTRGRIVRPLLDPILVEIHDEPRGRDR